MDETRFDRLARSFGTGSRRLGLRLLAGSAFSGLVAHSQLTASEAKKRKKKKKKCKGDTKKCGKKCIAATSCCKADDCGDGGTCAGGVCFCGGGFTLCQGTCIPDDACCLDADCGPGRVCLANGSCATECTFPGGPECHVSCNGCGFPSAEGPSHCIAIAQSGAGCSSTAGCPRGQHCQHIDSATGPTRCIALCAF